MDQYGYESFAGPSLNLKPEELDRLDASHYIPTEFPSIRVDDFRRKEDSINGTIRTLNERRTNFENYNSTFGKNFAELASPPRLPQSHQLQPQTVFTPPSSSQTNYHEKIRATENLHSSSSEQHPRALVELLKEERNKAISEMKALYDDRMSDAERREAERMRKLESENRGQLGRLQSEMEEVMHRHQQILKLKDEMEKSLTSQLEGVKKDLLREKDGREMDRDRYLEKIQKLKEKINDLERRLERGRVKTVSFADDSDLYDKDYERRLADLQRQNDVKVSNLIRHFEKEKSANLEIMKTNFDTKINQVVQRLKDHFRQQFNDRLQSVKEELVRHFRQDYEAKLQKMREEYSLERRIWQRQAREQVEQERVEIVQKLKAKYEMRIADVRHECEKRLSQRMKDSRRRPQRYSLYSDAEEDDSDYSFI